MFLCPPLPTVLDPRGRIPASSLAQVLCEQLFAGASPIYPSPCQINQVSAALLSLRSSGCPPWHSLSLSCLWTVSAWVTSLTWLSRAGSH